LLEAALLRAERLQPSLNAIVFRADELARGWANEASEGPFQGVPLLLKDILGLCKGMPTRMGSRASDPTPSKHDAEIVARFRRAGFVPFGKTNAPEFGLMPTTESMLHGAAHNPWDLSRTPGGSSGGSAAAVAAGIVPIAHGNDGGGSIRIPASCCGLVGLKPTRGRVSLAPGSDPTGLVIEGVLTRSVRDSAAALDAIAGSIPGDFHFFPPPATPFASAMRAPLGSLRIAVLESDPQGRAYSPDCSTALRATADLLTSLGHRVEAAIPKFGVDALSHAFAQIWFANAALLADGLALSRGQTSRAEEHDPLTWAMVEIGRAITATQLQIARFMLDGAARRVVRFMQPYDLVLMPTLSEPAFPLGQIDLRSTDVATQMERSGSWVAYAPIANAAGLPAISVPLHTSTTGLPIGMMFMAGMAAEARLLQLALQLEEALPWSGRHPALFG
jgi:amidase